MKWHNPSLALATFMLEASRNSSFWEYRNVTFADSNFKPITYDGCRILCALGDTEQPLIPSTWDFNKTKNVTWQTAWWSLVPLAIATMTQPCGNVLGQKDKNFRFYSRASPIICIADIFHFLGCIAFGFTFDCRIFLRNIKFELKQRFSQEERNADSHVEAERTRLARWMLLIISGIPCQTVKLAAMDGMFWTKFWAMSFFASIVFWEAITAISQSVRTNHPAHLPTPRWRKESSWIVGIMNTASPLSLACHFYAIHTAATTVFYWAIFSVSDLEFQHAVAITVSLTISLALFPVSIQYLRGRKVIEDIPITLLVLVVMVFVEFVTAKGLFTPRPFFNNVENWNRIRVLLDNYLRYGRNPPKVILADLLVPWTDISLGLQPVTVGHVIFRISEFVTGTVFCLSIPRVFGFSVLRKLFRVETADGSYAVFTFASTFLFSLLWYRFMFQPFGTYLPDWTEVFG